MRHASHRIACALFAACALAAGHAGPFGSSARAAAVPTPSAAAEMQTPPPLSATATPSPSGQLIKFSGQILDDQSGFVFFTTGDGFRLDPNLKIVDATTGGPTKLAPATATYARATFDSGNGRVVQLALSGKALPTEASYQDVKRFAVALSTPYANPDLTQAEGFTGQPVPVTFTVEVPSRTPFADEIYLATDASGWSATAIRMDRVDALHYRVTRTFPSGTRLLYRYTRGSWRSAEDDENGLQRKPRLLVVRNSDVQSEKDVVYSWGDEDQFAPDLGGAVPTPFNPRPFNLPPVIIKPH
jgi:hypothetical protein